MGFYKGIQTEMFQKLLKLAEFWNENNIILLSEINKPEMKQASIHLGCSPRVARDYLRALYLIVNHLADRKPLPSSSFADVEKKSLKKLLKLTNHLIKGEIQLNNHASKEQFLFLRDITKLLGVSTERTAWDYYKTLLQLTWMITKKFESEDKHKFMYYFSSAI